MDIYHQSMNDLGMYKFISEKLLCNNHIYKIHLKFVTDKEVFNDNFTMTSSRI